MEGVDSLTSTVAVLSAALLMVTAGIAKKQLVWKRPRTARARRRRNRR